MNEVKRDDIENGDNMKGEEVAFKNLDFTEKTIRRGLLRKVYGILMVLHLVTLGFVSVFMFVPQVKLFVYQNGAPFLLTGLVVATVTVIVLLCSTNMRRHAPANYIFLGVFTLAFSFLLGVICAISPREVYLGLAISTVVTVCLTIFAWQTKINFTMCYGGLFVLLLILITVGISSWFFPYNRIIHVSAAGIGAFVYSLLIMYDTQDMMD